MTTDGDKASSGEGPNPVDQLLDLLVHAPIGLLYERDKVMETVVKRGRSQVQLARLMAGMARQQVDVESKLIEAAGVAGTVVAKGITDVGTRLGLAPEPTAPSSLDERATRADGAEAAPADEPSTTEELAESAVILPIAGYDDLRAKDIVAMLADLTAEQRATVRAHETANRARKTVLGKLDQLEG